MASARSSRRVRRSTTSPNEVADARVSRVARSADAAQADVGRLGVAAQHSLMSTFVQITFSGLATGAIFALAAVGFALLWQTAGAINFAHGEFIVLPAVIMLILGKQQPTIGIPDWVPLIGGTELVGPTPRDRDHRRLRHHDPASRSCCSAMCSRCRSSTAC